MKTIPINALVSLVRQWPVAMLPCGLSLLLIFSAELQTSGALIGFYSFDDPDAPFADSSGAGNDLQTAGVDPIYKASGGVQGGAFSFDGSQRLISPVDINPDTIPTLTMGAWVKTSSLSSGLRKVMGQDNGGWDRAIGLDDREGPFRYTSFIGNGFPLLGAPGPVSVNDWTFLAAVYDQPNNTVTLYVDLDASTVGPLVEATSATGFGTGFSTLSIGSIHPPDNAEGWQGLIDNVFLFDEALTREQVTAIRDRGKNGLLGATDDPSVVVSGLPELQHLGKSPALHPFSITIQNGGLTKPLHISKVTITGPDAVYYSVNPLPPAIAPGATASIDIVFDPKGQVGVFTAAAKIESDDATQPSLSIDINSRIVAAPLLGFYSFDDTANPLKDDSGTGKTLQSGFDGGASDPEYQAAGGVEGGGFVFSGSQRLVAPININPSVVPILTMGAWVKTGSLEVGQRKIMGHDDGGWDRVIGLDARTQASGGPLPDGTLRYAAFTGSNNHGPTQGDPPPTPESTEAWSFVAAVYDQTARQVSLYVDLDSSTTGDDLQSIVTEADMGSGATAVSIGGLTPGANGEAWIGSIDNVFLIGGSVDAAGLQAIRDHGRSELGQFRVDPLLDASTASPFVDLPAGVGATTKQVPVANVGSVSTLRLDAFRLVGSDAAYYSVGAAPASLAPGQSGTISITFDPKGREGLFNAALELISNDGRDRKLTIDLTTIVPFKSVRSALIGFYSFDDEADPLKDDSGNGNGLTAPDNASPTFASQVGYEGSAYDFSGAQHLVAPIDINPDVQPKLTMGAWVKPSALAGGLHKVIGSDDGGWDRTIGLDNRDGPLATFRYSAFIGNAPPILGTPEPQNTDDWTFLAATYDQLKNEIVLYVDLNASTHDDDLQAFTSPTGFGGGFPTVSIGSLRPDNVAEGWIGMIDNAFFYRTVLSAADLLAIRNGGVAAILGTSSIVITEIKKTTDLSLTWTSESGKTYSIEYSQSLGGPWDSIGTVPGLANSSTFKDSDATRLSRNSGFYRIVLQP